MGRRARDLDPLDDRRRALAGGFYGRALAIAASLARGLPSHVHDDVRSAAGWGCVYAAATWEPGRGDWEPYAYHKVRAKVLDAIRSARRRLDKHLDWTWQTERDALFWW